MMMDMDQELFKNASVDTHTKEARNDRAMFGDSGYFKSSVLQNLLRPLYERTSLLKCCRWAISVVAAFRSGVISIDNAEPNMDLVYALGLMTGFFIFSLHPILDRFIMQNKWMDFVKDLFVSCFD